MPPPFANRSARSSTHWRVIYREKMRYLETLDLLFAAKQMPAPPALAPHRVQVTSVMYLGARMDVDNAMARHKWALDWLAKQGYVDNDKHFEWQTFPEQIVKRGAEYRIEFTLRVLP
jgi:hypothetical protein